MQIQIQGYPAGLWLTEGLIILEMKADNELAIID